MERKRLKGETTGRQIPEGLEKDAGKPVASECSSISHH